MDPVEAIGEHGIAHQRSLRDAGVRPIELRRAVEQGQVRRVRRDWFFTPGCHRLVLRAVASNATLACVSAAAVRGLWSGTDAAVHVSAARGNGRVDRTAKSWVVDGGRPIVVHWTRHPTPGPAQGVRAVIDDLPQMLKQVAACQSHEHAVAVFDSVLRNGLASTSELRSIGRTAGPAFRRIVDATHSLADSGIESIPRVRLARIGVTMIPQVVIDGHHVDGLIGERLVMQFDGFGPHGTRAQRNKDLAEDGRLQQMGYVVLRYTYDQVLYEWPKIESTVRSVIAQGRHMWPQSWRGAS